ncbi:4,5-dihydroxyphthalate decarboxylase [Rhodoplanes sp. Z2-YC6860]|uniref:4,5-dihydroxyphthalate decarboxylase n=1 Tax=Rhodoplanes sp. Z2-YC6860 TaxID=674703 RepID=UPI00078EA99F|nr:4,5-dihydroxyphthalate decarboxylase [Rhodoplanes sp. Z2-YC6860]AMN45235.1 4,5-dihydroxyphthalate decarboxylase [Rhodoplanes sp. Z2-YC6860]
MSKLPLTLATSHYEHINELVTGRVPVEGVDLTVLMLQIEEIFFRQFNYFDFDVSEVSMAKYCSLVSQGNSPLVAIPVFPSRVPRHSSVYINRKGPVKKPEDLAGKRIGIPEWAQTASVYSRGFIQHQYGVDLASIHWVQAGVDQPGRQEKVKLKLPPGIKYESRPDKSLGGMLISGEIDAALAAHAPKCFEDGHPDIVRLFPDYLDIEMKYVKETGIYPIMHTIAFKRDVIERNPWMAVNLFRAFEEARRRSVERVLSGTSSVLPLPWAYEFMKRMQDVVGPDLMPNGVEQNRTTLEAFLQYAFEQGVLHRKLTPEELFPAQVLKSFKV